MVAKLIVLKKALSESGLFFSAITIVISCRICLFLLSSAVNTLGKTSKAK